MRSSLRYLPAFCLGGLITVSVAAAPTASLPDELHNQVLQMGTSGRSAEALVLSIAALQENPADAILTDIAGGLFVSTDQQERGRSLASALETEGRPGIAALLRGAITYYAGDPEDALSDLNSAVSIFRETGEEEALVVALVRCGSAHQRLRQQELARVFLEEAWNAEAAVELIHLRIEAGDLLGSVLARLGALHAADSINVAAMELARETGDPLLARVINNVGYLKGRLGDFSTARVHYAEAAAMALVAGDTLGYVRRATRSAEMAERTGDYEGALVIYRSAREEARRLKAEREEVSVLVAMAVGFRRRGNPVEAVALCESALVLAQGGEVRRHDVFRAHGVRGNALFDLGRVREARLAHEASEPLVRRPMQRAGVLNNLGNVVLALGDVEEALRHYRQALSISEERDDVLRSAMYRANMASCYDRLGRYEEAIAMFTAASAVFEEKGEYLQYTHTLLDRALLLERMGDDETAERLLREAIDRLEGESIRSRLPGCRIALAGIYRRRAEFEAAHRELQSAHATALAMESMDETLRAVAALARLGLARGDLDAAEAWAAKGLDSSRSSEFRSSTAVFANLLGEVTRRREPTVSAARWYREALDASRRSVDLGQEISAWMGLARSLASTDTQESLRAYRAAIDRIERLRLGVGGERELWSVFGGYAAAHAEAAALLAAEAERDWDGARNGEAAREGFLLAETGRARTFLERLVQAGVDPDLRVPEELREERNENLRRYNYVHSELIGALESGDTKQAGTLSETMQRLDEAYTRIEGRIGASEGAFANLRAFAPASIAEVAYRLPEDAALVEYVETEQGYSVFLIQKAGEIRGFRLPGVRRADLETFRSHLEMGRSPATFDTLDFGALGQKLHSGLLGPVIDHLGTLPALLMVVPDGALWSIPFEALVTGGEDPDSRQFLFESTAVVYAPSATAFVKLQERATKRAIERSRTTIRDRGGTPTTLIVADPVYPGTENGQTEVTRSVSLAMDAREGGRGYDFAPLPFTRNEAEGIEAALGRQSVRFLAGSEASEDRFKTEPLREYRTIHLAAHSFIDEAHPQTSAIVLSLDDDPLEDGFLTIRELYDLDLAADLVVLSACRSAGGPAIRGEGAVALARPFLTAGASAAVVTLWPVNDRSTAMFMKAFYLAQAEGSSPTAAMAEARRALLIADRPAWRLPYHWAPFVLVGSH